MGNLFVNKREGRHDAPYKYTKYTHTDLENKNEYQ